MKHNFKFLDFEVYPHWWCLVTSEEEDNYNSILHDNKFTKEDELNIKSKMKVYTSDYNNANYLEQIKNDVNKGVLCGYNIKGYDLAILNGVLLGFSPEKLYALSQVIVDRNKINMSPVHARVAAYANKKYFTVAGYQDLLDDSDKSLKDKECSLGMDIRETTVPFDKEELSNEEKDEIIFYCKHDVYALHVLYKCVSNGYIDTKITLGDTFNIDKTTCYKCTNATLVGKALDAKRVHGTAMIDATITIRNERLEKYFRENIPAEIYTHLLTSKANKKWTLYDNTVITADGGLHSTYNIDGDMLYVESTDTHTMFNIDVSSCYASVMMYCDAMSRAVREPQRMHDIYDRRIKLKFTPKSQWTQDDKNFVAAGKLVLNTAYGAMGREQLDLYDDYMRSKVCRVGQMVLIAIANKLYKSIPGLKVIQNNTDGVLVYTERANYDKIKEIIDEFTDISNFIFEIEEDAKLWQYDVNNYVAIHPDGEVKNKGGRFTDTVYEPVNKLKPLGNFVVAKSQINFFVNGDNAIKYLLNDTNVEDFCLTCTKGPTYNSMVQYTNDGVIQLGKVARVIAVKDNNLGIIKKIKTYKKESKNHTIGELKEDTVALCPPHPLLVNDALYNYYIKDKKLYHVDGRSWDIDYLYYSQCIEQAFDTVNYKMINNEPVTITNEFNLECGR